MLIGLDFDNTIVDYDALFHRVALEQGLIGADLPPRKLAVRDHLRSSGRETQWTEMQGHVYGARMDEACGYPGVVEFLRWARQAGHRLAIVSHKTRYPFAGPAYDLHATARTWIARRLGATAPDAVYFELSQAEKIARIALLGCDIFLDDLPEVFLAEQFPATTRPCLFDPDARHADVPRRIHRVRSWREFTSLAQCHASR